MKFDEAINEHDGYKDPDQDPTSHHPRAAVAAAQKSIRRQAGRSPVGGS